jgi:lipid II:glycine glycyltransferase (peptidoglycan interpeptide bridge formation enzyme)
MAPIDLLDAGLPQTFNLQKKKKKKKKSNIRTAKKRFIPVRSFK